LPKLRSMDWRPQELSLPDSTSSTVQQFALTGDIDIDARDGKVRIFIDPHTESIKLSISRRSITRASALFSERINLIQAGRDAPTVLRHGPKVVLHVLPISAIEGGRDIDHSSPNQLSSYITPDGYSPGGGRTRQEGWVWHQPREALPGLPNPASWWYSRLDWNGFVEIVETLEETGADEYAATIGGYSLERHIVRTLDRIAEGYDRLFIRSPAIIQVGLLDVLGTKLVKSTAGFTSGFDRPMIITSPLVVSNMRKPLGVAIRPILDSLWRAAGWPDGSPSYGQGDWDGYKNIPIYQ